MENETNERNDEDNLLESMQRDVDLSPVGRTTHEDSKERMLFGARGFTKEGMVFLLKEMVVRHCNRELSIERVIHAIPDCFDATEVDLLLGMALASTPFLQGLLVPIGDRISMELAKFISLALEQSTSIQSLVLTRLLTFEIAQGQIIRELLHGFSLNRNQRSKQIRLYSLGRQEEFLEDNAGRNGIVQAIGQAPGLTDIECSACSADAVVTFLEGACLNESIKRVTLICDSVRDEGWDGNQRVPFVLRNLIETSSSLRELKLIESRISDRVAQSFFIALAQPISSLKNMEVKIEKLSASSINCLQSTLRSNRSLRNVTVQCATTEGSLADALSLIFEEKTCHLESLSLLDVPIGPDSLDRFLLSIRDVDSFISLTLEENGRDNDHALESIHRVCAHLPHLVSLKKLCYAPSVRFPRALWDDFLEAVAANTTLTEINVGDFDPSYLEIGVGAIAKRNRFRLMVVDKKTSRCLWPLAIRSLQKDESAMFECLKLIMDKIVTSEG